MDGRCVCLYSCSNWSCVHWQLLQTIIFRIIGVYRIFTNDTRVSLCIYGMSFFCYLLGIVEKSLILLYQGFLFTMSFLLCEKEYKSNGS